jgi:hypothetical protein
LQATVSGLYDLTFWSLQRDVLLGARGTDAVATDWQSEESTGKAHGNPSAQRLGIG